MNEYSLAKVQLIDYAAKISKIICMAKKNDENIVDFEEF